MAFNIKFHKRTTIKFQLWGLTLTALAFVLAVSITGFWGVILLNRSTSQVARAGEAIRTHGDVAVYNDATRNDITAVYKAKGDDQQSAAEELKQHMQLLKARIEATQKVAITAKSRLMLDEEKQLSERYETAGENLAGVMIHNPDQAGSLLGPFLQLYKELQGKVDATTEELAKNVQEAESGAKRTTIEATAGISVICGACLIILSVGSVRLVGSISKALSRLIKMIHDIAEGEGDVTKRLEISGNFDNDELGEVGRLFNLFMDKLQEILRGIVAETHKLASASEQLLQASELITTNSGRTAVQSNSASLATQQVTDRLTQLSLGAREMTTTINSIAGNAQEAANVAATAVDAAQAANATIAKLGQSGMEIGTVVKAIAEIAKQTNMLALNATIEAARAGNAGKSFAVVAKEVDELAKQTANLTEDISQKIETIHTNTNEAVAAIGNVGGVIHNINDISATIATAVHQQGGTTTEMTRNANEAAGAAAEISESIGSVAQAADNTLRRAEESQKAAADLAAIAKELKNLVRQFKIERSEPRIDLNLTVRLRARDAEGRAFDQNVNAVNISRHGAHLQGVRGKLRQGDQVLIERHLTSEQFTVMWIKSPGSGFAEIGVHAVNPSSTFWDDVLEFEEKEQLVTA